MGLTFSSHRKYPHKDNRTEHNARDEDVLQPSFHTTHSRHLVQLPDPWRNAAPSLLLRQEYIQGDFKSLQVVCQEYIHKEILKVF